MKFYEYQVINSYTEVEDTKIIQVKLVDNNTRISFLPGQYCFIKNPKSQTPSESHPFSIASSPTNKDYIEFCIKKLGDWTNEFVSGVTIGDKLQISSPTGSFVWDNKFDHAIFLLGGIGISPIKAMLEYISDTKQTPRITMLYGNRTAETVAYRKELDHFVQTISLNVVDIYSHISKTDSWNGYRGFITEEIVRKEVNLSKKPTFFVIGPPIFNQKMELLLRNLSIHTDRIKFEKL